MVRLSSLHAIANSLSFSPSLSNFISAIFSYYFILLLLLVDFFLRKMRLKFYLWRWQAIDFVRLNHSTISFFNLPETAASRWTRVKLNASKVSFSFSFSFSLSNFFCFFVCIRIIVYAAACYTDTIRDFIQLYFGGTIFLGLLDLDYYLEKVRFLCWILKSIVNCLWGRWERVCP